MPSIALPVSLRGQLLSGTRTFSPASLFAANEPGVWFDPSDLTTLFTDPAGTTPVTTPGQTVGLMLDKSKGLVPGPDLITNGDFASGTTGWTAASGAVLSNNAERLQIVASGGAQGTTQAFTTTAGVRYQGTVTVASATATYYIGYGNALGQGQVFASAELTGSRTYTFSFVGNGTSTTFWLYANAPGTFIFDNISVRELAGNHATQATLAARPTYSIEPVGGRRNLLTWSEDFTNAIWTKGGVSLSAGSSAASRIVTATSANGAIYQLVSVSPSAVVCNNSIEIRRITGTGAIQLKLPGNGGNPISVTSEWVRFSASGAAGGTINYFVLEIATSGDAVEIRYPQAELGSTATPYQRVTTQHDVTEAGVASLSYLYFDGTDDCLVTGVNSSFTYTGGISLFAGFEKLGATKIYETLLAYGGGASTQSMAFQVTDSGSNRLATDIWSPSGVRGSTVLLSPSKGVATFNIQNWSTHRLSGTEIRLNGVAETVTAYGLANPIALNVSTIRVGVFDQTLGTSFLFGKIYSLIARGVATDAPTIASTEVWVAGKTGFYTPIITGVPTIGVS